MAVRRYRARPAPLWDRAISPSRMARSCSASSMAVSGSGGAGHPSRVVAAVSARRASSAKSGRRPSVDRTASHPRPRLIEIDAGIPEKYRRSAPPAARASARRSRPRRVWLVATALDLDASTIEQDWLLDGLAEASSQRGRVQRSRQRSGRAPRKSIQRKPCRTAALESGIAVSSSRLRRTLRTSFSSVGPTGAIGES